MPRHLPSGQRLILGRFLLRTALGLAVLPTILTEPVSAQGFFETLFGSPSSQVRPPASRLRPPQDIAPEQPTSRSSRPEGSSRPNESGPGYRTVCVRLCDGYFWPLSHSVPRSRLAEDENRCRSSCSSPARLYHQPATSGSSEDLVDGSGAAYTRQTNAFRYRKALVHGCSCKPEPWSESELRRHQTYAPVVAIEPLQALTEEATQVPAKPAAVASTRTPSPEASEDEQVVTPPSMATAASGSPTVGPAPTAALPAASAVGRPRPAKTVAEVRAFKPERPLANRASISRPSQARHAATGQSTSLPWMSSAAWPGDQPVRRN